MQSEELKDKKLKCQECGSEFIFTSSEQKFYKEKGFEHEPTRCPNCRNKRKKVTLGKVNILEFCDKYEVICSNCKKKCYVLFQPKDNKPVYCQDCLKQMKKKA